MRSVIAGRRPVRHWSKGALAVGSALACLVLSGCDESGQPRVNSKICANFNTAAPGGEATDPAAPTDACVRRWAYSLAGARDTADIVAAAAVAACGATLTRWNQTSMDQTQLDSTGAPVQSLNVDTGQPTNALAEHNGFAHRQALLYVVEARAGHCRPPPVVKGAPAGG